jgi:hypothetical protein
LFFEKVKTIETVIDIALPVLLQDRSHYLNFPYEGEAKYAPKFCEDMWGSGCVAVLSLNFALGRGEWSVSQIRFFNLGQSAPESIQHAAGWAPGLLFFLLCI